MRQHTSQHGQRREAREGPGRCPLAWLLLARPVLERTGLLKYARASYGRLRNGFYGLTATLLTLAMVLGAAARAAGRGRGPSRTLGAGPVPSGSQLGLDTSRRTSYRHHGGATPAPVQAAFGFTAKTNTGGPLPSTAWPR